MGRLNDDRMADGKNDDKTIDLELILGPTLFKKRFNEAEHILKRRVPCSFLKRKKDIYATRKSAFKAQLSICEKLLEAGEPEIIIHGLGAAINRACNLALQLKKNHHGTLDIDVHTSTVRLIDDLEPKNESADYDVNARYNSSMHIRVFRTVAIGPLKYA